MPCSRFLSFLFAAPIVFSVLSVTSPLPAEPPPSADGKEEIRVESAYLHQAFQGAHRFRLGLWIDAEGGYGYIEADSNSCQLNLFGEPVVTTLALSQPRTIRLTRITDSSITPNYDDSAGRYRLYQIKYSGKVPVDAIIKETKSEKELAPLYIAIPHESHRAFRLLFASDGEIEQVIPLEREIRKPVPKLDSKFPPR